MKPIPDFHYLHPAVSKWVWDDIRYTQKGFCISWPYDFMNITQTLTEQLMSEKHVHFSHVSVSVWHQELGNNPGRAGLACSCPYNCYEVRSQQWGRAVEWVDQLECWVIEWWEQRSASWREQKGRCSDGEGGVWGFNFSMAAECVSDRCKRWESGVKCGSRLRL